MKHLRILFLFILVTALPVSAEPRDPYKHFFNETWGDFREELNNARQQGKQGILIFFEMDECPFCHYMKHNVLNQPEVQEYYRKHFLNFAVDIEGDIEIVNLKGKQTKQKDFAFKEYRVRATPVIMLFDLDGKPVHKHIGKTAGVDEFMLIGDFVVNGHYKKMKFTRYKREHGQKK
ncbi:MAG: thioredoxin fold domain-containing protein [Gammaproteobacteria bacterium]|nr:thioredoxin fold domain-containing protein [Gammaproteobacteria bacterium]MDH5650966.1 thioredoxin fold domain-containing protein [Gammaproteobacteria bacterium]